MLLCIRSCIIRNYISNTRTQPKWSDEDRCRRWPSVLRCHPSTIIFSKLWSVLCRVQKHLPYSPAVARGELFRPKREREDRDGKRWHDWSSWMPDLASSPNVDAQREDRAKPVWDKDRFVGVTAQTPQGIKVRSHVHPQYYGPLLSASYAAFFLSQAF